MPGKVRKLYTIKTGEEWELPLCNYCTRNIDHCNSRTTIMSQKQIEMCSYFSAIDDLEIEVEIVELHFE